MFIIVMGPGLHTSPSLLSVDFFLLFCVLRGPRPAIARFALAPPSRDNSQCACHPYLEPDWSGLPRATFLQLCPATVAWNLIGAATYAPVKCSAAIRGRGTTKAR